MNTTSIPAELNFEASVQWKERTIGELEATGIDYMVVVATPPEFPDGLQGIWSPEHLLLGAISSCFMSTFLSIAKRRQLAFTGFTCNAKGKVGRVNGKYSFTQINVFPLVTLAGESSRQLAEQVLQRASGACLVSNSLRSHIAYHAGIIVEDGAEHFLPVMYHEHLPAVMQPAEA